MNLGVRLTPYDGEALGGFLQRLADRNGHSMLSLLYCFLHPSKKTLKQADIARIDCIAKNILNFKSMEQYIGVSSSKLKQHSLWSTISHFVDDGEISSTKIMREMIRIDYAYCPQCIYEYKYRKLMWNLKVISYCPDHNLHLNEVCTHCRKPIKLTHLRDCSLCPYCSGYLGGEGKERKVNKDDIYESFIRDSFTRLQDESIPYMNTQQVAQKLIYMLVDKDQPIDNEQLKNRMGGRACAEYLLQQARGSSLRRVHLLQIFDLLFINKWSIDDFIQLKVPGTFTARLTGHLQLKMVSSPPLIKRKVVQPPRKYNNAVSKQIEDICTDIHLKGGKITNLKVVKQIGISDNTLRKWGMLHTIEDCKKAVKRREHKEMEVEWERRINLFLEEEAGDIHTNDIYEYIGVKPAVIRKIAPNLIALIQEIRSDIRATQRFF